MLRYLNRLRSAVKRKRRWRAWNLTQPNPREIWVYREPLALLGKQRQVSAAIFRENPEPGKLVRFREVGE